MNLIVQLIVGGVIGWLASILMKTNAQMGIILNVVMEFVNDPHRKESNYCCCP